MPRIRSLLLAALLLGALAPELSAQSYYQLVLQPGTAARLRTAAAPEARITGRVLGSDNDSLLVAARGQPVGQRYALRELHSLEVRGDPDHLRGTLIGAGIGAGIGLLSGGIDAARGKTVGGEVITFSIIDGLIGAVFGYIFAPKGWQPLPLPR